MFKFMIVFFLVALVAGGIYFAVISLDKQTVMKEEYVITAITGDVTVQSKGEAEHKAAKSETLRRDDVVKTKGNSKVDLLFTTGKAARLKDNSTLRVDSDPGVAAPKVHLTKGAVLAKIAKAGSEVPKGTNIFTVSTPQAVAGVRGTAFSVELYTTMGPDGPKLGTRVSVLEGTVKVTATSSSLDAGVVDGKKVEVTESTKTPEPVDTTKEEKETLHETQQITAKTSYVDTVRKTVSDTMDTELCAIVTNITKMEMRNIQMSAIEYSYRHKEMPATLYDLNMDNPKKVFTDSCGVPYLYVRTGQYTAELRSAGPDMRMNTGDDLVTKMESVWKMK